VVIADGELAARARLLNQPFRKHARTGRPWVLFKSAMTLDGKVATRGGDSKWISSEDSRRLAHHWRAQCDAVAVGIGTALADDPQLTARIEGVVRQPRRVVFDSVARLPLQSKLVRDARRIPLTVVVSRAAPRAAIDALATHGADIVVATGENETARVRSALVQLGAAGIGSILLEGGPHLAGAFLDAGELDEIRLFLAPMVLGGRTARDPLEGRIASVDRSESGARIAVETPLVAELQTGDSIAVNGVCLSATSLENGSFLADAMNETLSRTSLGDISPGAEVNLELPLRASDRLGGHVVQGHVDGVGRIASVTEDGFARRVQVDAPADVLRYVIEKGSIAVDGVSLTVTGVDSRSFTVSLIPDTLLRTNLGHAAVGDRVNLEVDVLAKYVEKLIRR